MTAKGLPDHGLAPKITSGRVPTVFLAGTGDRAVIGIKLGSLSNRGLSVKLRFIVSAGSWLSTRSVGLSCRPPHDGL